MSMTLKLIPSPGSIQKLTQKECYMDVAARVVTEQYFQLAYSILATLAALLKTLVFRHPNQ